jgi:hypothetical protein
VGAIRLRVSARADGELRLRGLPIRKGEQAEVIVLTDSLDEPMVDEVTLAILQHDPDWAGSTIRPKTCIRRQMSQAPPAADRARARRHPRLAPARLRLARQEAEGGQGMASRAVRSRMIFVPSVRFSSESRSSMPWYPFKSSAVKMHGTSPYDGTPRWRK